MAVTSCSQESETVETDFSKTAINLRLSSEAKLRLYRDMVRIRRFEERAIRSYQEGKIGGFCHTYIGQESVAVGALSVIGPNDHVITAYRDHGHGLMMGISMEAAMSELYGKSTGCSKGKGGSMHFFAPEKRFWGGHGIVGAQVPLGTGIGFALKYRQTKGCCICFLGDGAMNQGTVYESFNLAALWDLPVVYIIENNLYSMGTSQECSSAGSSLARRAIGFDMTYDTVPAHLLYAVRTKTAQALQQARKDSRPTVLEIITYRYRGHSMSDPDKTYRSKKEIETYKKTQDPITLYKQHLLEQNIADETTLKSIDTAARKEANAAAQFADNGPFPRKEALLEDVYWEVDHPQHKTSQGTLFLNQP